MLSMKIEYIKKGNIGIFTIDNGKVNVFTEEMHSQLLSHLFCFLRDDSVKVGILTGSQGKCFSAGDDLSEGDSYESFGAEGSSSSKVMALTRKKPIIASVNGWCLGQGFVYLSELTDIRISGKSASFGLPEISYGMGGASGALRLKKKISTVAANWLGLTGEKISAAKALELQLINEVVDDENVFERALEVAQMIAKHPLIAIQTEMDCMNRCNEMGRLEAMDYAMTQYEQQLKHYAALEEAQSGIEHIKSKKEQ